VKPQPIDIENPICPECKADDFWMLFPKFLGHIFNCFRCGHEQRIYREELKVLPEFAGSPA